MPNWGGLNNALASWRTGLNALLPKRSTRSDGARADGAHSSTSEHQPDSDGTVDAFDEDRNFLGSSDQDGSATEDRIKAALDRDFMADSRAHLIISDRKIANDQIGNWKWRPYGGASPHTEHTHRQVHQSKEDDGRPWAFTHTRALLRELEGPRVTTPTADQMKSAAAQGVLAYAGGGLPSWAGAPAGRNFLNSFTELFREVQEADNDLEAVDAAVIALSAMVAAIVEDPAGMADPETHPIVKSVRYALENPRAEQ